MAYDKYKSGFEETYLKECAFEDILEHADVLSLHLPLTEETSYFFNEKTISAFKKPFYLINTSRGKVVNTSDLIKGLEKNKIIGAALDVMENEKFKSYKDADYEWFSNLKSNPNVILTPHIAGWSRESKFKKLQNLIYWDLRTN